ncbi:unnamed protein product [Trichobilharzia szidati]|nr:unnamed protein product [Trichobilharzia szidati]
MNPPHNSQSNLSIRNDAKKLLEPNTLVELAQCVENANSFVAANACSRLHLIVEQMHHLKSQAETILKNAHRDTLLHKLPCNFVKKPGNIYYVYKKPNVGQYLSMLSPKEWENCPHEYVGAYKLLPDMSWIPEDDIDTYESISNTALQMLDRHQFMLE